MAAAIYMGNGCTLSMELCCSDELLRLERIPIGAIGQYCGVGLGINLEPQSGVLVDSNHALRRLDPVAGPDPTAYICVNRRSLETPRLY